MMDALGVSRRVGRWFLAVLLVVLSVGAFAQGGNQTFVPGELLMSLPRGTDRAAVNTLVNSVNGDIVHSYGPVDYEQRWDLYLVRLRPVSAQPVTPEKTLQAIGTLKQDPRVRYAGPNRIGRPDQSGGPTAIPNDPLFSQLWGMRMINMPQAWTLEKGQSNVVVAVIDTGVDIDHPEFQGRIVNPLNVTNPPTVTTDPRPTAGAGEEHGTHVAGTAIALTNNGIGVAGVVWENAKLMPIKSSLTEASDILAYQEVLKYHTANPDIRIVCNNSYNLGDATDDNPPAPGTDPAADAILNLAKNDVIMVMSGGNLGAPGDGNPPRRLARMAAAHENIFSVAAVNHLGTRAYYSSFRPTNTIAAPGGDALAGQEILSTWPGNQYMAIQGTSMATPHVTGVIGLLLSVPGVKSTDIKGVITSTAKPVPGATVPSPEYGYGIVDAYAALLKVAVAVTIVEPQGTGGKASGSGQQPEPVETLRPLIRIQVNQITPDNLTVTLDGVVVPKDTPGASGVSWSIVPGSIRLTQKDDDGNDIPLIYDIALQTDLPPGQHTVQVTGVKPGPPDRTVTDLRNITIQPHLVPQGRSLISIPYFQETDRSGTVLTPDQLLRYYFGTDFRLARWLPDLARYVFASSFGIVEPGFVPPAQYMPKQAGTGKAVFPLGLGMWSDTDSNKPILTRGEALTDQAIILPLKGTGTTGGIAWHLIGDPFPFDVGFNSLLVDAPQGRLTIQQAAEAGLILANLYAYDGENGYTFRTLPDGVLRAWTGYWVGVTSSSDIALVVPPAKITRAASLPVRSTSVGAGGWSLRMGASVRDLRDTFNFIGVSTRAADAYDRTDVAKPPMVSPYVTLGVSHEDWGGRSGLYAQDLRSPGGRKAWEMVVNTDQPDSSVTVTWNAESALPRNLKLTIKDEVTGQVTDMRTRSSLTFNSGTNPGPRRFTVAASPLTGGFIRLSNVTVRSSGRAAGAGSVIEYTLSGDATAEVKILSATGSTISTVTSRAVSAGTQRVMWNGKNTAGTSVPAGTYLVQIRAIGPDGDVVKVVQPFAILR